MPLYYATGFSRADSVVRVRATTTSMAPNSNDVTRMARKSTPGASGLGNRRSKGNNFDDNAIRMREIIN
jgi:hypothetical protein